MIDREPDADKLLEPRVGKRWQLSAEAQYRSLLITDEDPELALRLGASF